MKAWIRKTGAAVKSEPINHQAWRETVDDFDNVLQAAFDQDTEEAAVEAWLENPQAFLGQPESGEPSLKTAMVRRMPTGGNGLRRAGGIGAKQAAASNWDSEFANAKANAASVLQQLGRQSPLTLTGREGAGHPRQGIHIDVDD